MKTPSKLDKAIAYKHQHPQESFSKVADRFEVPSSTLNDRIIGNHTPRGTRTPRNLSVEQEAALIATINRYAKRGTLLTPGQVREFAEKLGGKKFGKNWVSTFIGRHKDEILSQFFKAQELARLQADTPETRQIFHSIVQDAYNDYAYKDHNIYNMDECGFSLSLSQKVRRVAPVDSAVKSQATLPNNIHITLVATISTTNAPVRPYIIYPGQIFIAQWFKINDRQPDMLGDVTASGYANQFTHMRRLEKCFDPNTRDCAKGR